MTKANPEGVELCAANKAESRGGGTCRLRAGYGTDHVGYGRCKYHGGASPNGMMAAEKQRINETLAQGMIRKRVVDPVTLMLEEVYRCAGIVEYLEELIAIARDDQLTENSIGGEQLSMWVRQWEKERLTALHASAVAARAGVQERVVRMAEDQGRLVVRTVTALINDPRFKITQEQRNVFPALAREHFQQLTSQGSIDVGSTAHGE